MARVKVGMPQKARVAADDIRCTATVKNGKRRGERCSNSRHGGSKEFCFFHDPAMTEQRRENCRKGGRNGSAIVIHYDALPTTRLSTRGLIAELARLYQSLDEELLTETSIERAKLKIKTIKELRGCIRQVRQEEGDMPPIRVQIEQELADAGSQLSLAQVIAMREGLHSAERDLDS